MDIYGACSTAVRDIYAISVFISQVIDGVKNRGKILGSLQAEFSHEFLFLESFHTIFFSDENGSGTWFSALHGSFQNDIRSILLGLEQGIGSYGVVALKHGLDLSAIMIPPESASGDENSLPRRLVSGSRGAKKSKELTERVKAKIHDLMDQPKVKQKWLNIALPIFDEDQIKKLLAHCQKWIKKLREVMMLVLAMQRPIGAYSASNLSQDPNYSLAKHLGLEKPLRRQMRAHSNLPADFGPLKGALIPTGAATNSDRPCASYIIGEFEDQYLDLIPVLEESHDLAIGSTSLTEDEKQEWKLRAVVNLAWLLQSQDPMEPESISPKKGADPMLVLHCLGYRVERGLSLVFQLPIGTNVDSVPQSLHDWIVKDEETMLDLRGRKIQIRSEYMKCVAQANRAADEGGGTQKERQAARKAQYEILKKRCEIIESLERFEKERLADQPSLSCRYFLAWALASTVYHIHASGWVHKGIRSRSILMLKDPRAPAKHQENLPYMLGWSASRPQTSAFVNVSCPVETPRGSDVLESGMTRDTLGPSEDMESCIKVTETSAIDKTEKEVVVKGYLASRQAHLEDDLGVLEATEQKNHDIDALNAASQKAYDLEKDLYMHRDRHPGSHVTFQNKHDIHSLGVVLLEIGLWSTLSMEMHIAIATARKSNNPPPPTRMNQLYRHINSMAREARLERLMGNEYAQIVSMCLEGGFESLSQDDCSEKNDADAVLTREFHAKVIEPLRKKAAWC